MIDLKLFSECLQREGVEFICGVPDTLLNDFCLQAEAVWPRERHVIAANEGNAVALAVGYHLATGSVPLIYMQNSGIGNSVNPLLSLAHPDVYSIPLVLLIGWRGDPSIKDHAQHRKQGELTPVLLDAMGIPFRVLEEDLTGAMASASWAVQAAREQSRPAALVVRKSVLANKEKEMLEDHASPFSLRRESAMACVLAAIPENTICVASTGRATRELYALRNARGEAHDTDFLNVGAMGHASSIAAGIALAARHRQVVCFDGDAAAIMHLGSWLILGELGLPNVLHVILNNGAHESVGGQPSAGFTANLTAIAEGAGYKTVGASVRSESDLKSAVKKLLTAGGPAFIDVHVRKGIRRDLAPLRVNLVEQKIDFCRAIAACK